MDRPIQVGDLVQVVRWPCCDKHLGKTTDVVGFYTIEGGGAMCCGSMNYPVGAAGAILKGQFFAPISWLKRIPPLDELEGTKTDEPMKEPA